jgi:hypothetical protein
MRRGLLASLLALSVGVACTSRSPAPGPSPGGSASGPPPVHPSSTTTLPSASPSLVGPAPDVFSLGGHVTALAPGPDAVLYAAYVPPQHRTTTIVVRLDTSTGAVRTSTPIAEARGPTTLLAFAGRSLWMATGPDPASGILYRLSGTTLRELDRRPMNGAPSGLAPVEAGLWVAEADRLLLLDPANGEVRRTVTLGGEVTHLVADPRGDLLYASAVVPTASGRRSLLVELDAGSGALLEVTSAFGSADLGGLSGLSATDDGVWITAPTGTEAKTVLVRASDLHEVANVQPPGPNTTRADVAGGVLWVSVPTGGYRCVDPATGKVLGRLATASAITGLVVATGTGLYSTGWRTVVEVRPGPACR